MADDSRRIIEGSLEVKGDIETVDGSVLGAQIVVLNDGQIASDSVEELDFSGPGKITVEITDGGSRAVVRIEEIDGGDWS